MKFRGWFVNDETLIMNWKLECRADLPWIMVFETLLRCNGNLIIPSTYTNAETYRMLASNMV